MNVPIYFPLQRDRWGTNIIAVWGFMLVGREINGLVGGLTKELESANTKNSNGLSFEDVLMAILSQRYGETQGKNHQEGFEFLEFGQIQYLRIKASDKGFSDGVLISEQIPREFAGQIETRDIYSQPVAGDREVTNEFIKLYTSVFRLLELLGLDDEVKNINLKSEDLVKLGFGIIKALREELPDVVKPVINSEKSTHKAIDVPSASQVGVDTDENSQELDYEVLLKSLNSLLSGILRKVEAEANLESSGADNLELGKKVSIVLKELIADYRSLNSDKHSSVKPDSEEQVEKPVGVKNSSYAQASIVKNDTAEYSGKSYGSEYIIKGKTQKEIRNDLNRELASNQDSTNIRRSRETPHNMEKPEVSGYTSGKLKSHDAPKETPKSVAFGEFETEPRESKKSHFPIKQEAEDTPESPQSFQRKDLSLFHLNRHSGEPERYGVNIRSTPNSGQSKEYNQGQNLIEIDSEPKEEIKREAIRDNSIDMKIKPDVGTGLKTESKPIFGGKSSPLQREAEESNLLPNMDKSSYEEGVEEKRELTQVRATIPESKGSDTKNVFLRLEDASVRMKFLNERVIVDARFKEETNVYVSYMDSRKLYESLKSLGFNLEVLRVNGIDISPRTRGFSKREDRYRENLTDEERTPKETSAYSGSSSGFSLLL